MGGPWPWKRAERTRLEGRARRAEQAKKQTKGYRFSCLDRGLVHGIFKLAWKSYFRWYASLSSLLGCESSAKEVGLPSTLPWELPRLLSLWFHCKYLLPSRNALSWLYVHKFSRISIAIWWVEGGRPSPSFFSMEARITLDVGRALPANAWVRT